MCVCIYIYTVYYIILYIYIYTYISTPTMAGFRSFKLTSLPIIQWDPVEGLPVGRRITALIACHG